jgi:hypothetical protein
MSFVFAMRSIKFQVTRDVTGSMILIVGVYGTLLIQMERRSAVWIC